MDDLSYREYRVTVNIETKTTSGSYLGFISPATEGVTKEAWDLMSAYDRNEWLQMAASGWAMEAIEISWE